MAQVNDFLPIKHEDMLARSWEQLDVIIVSGDAYVDHPAFAAALLGRLLESKGYRVGILAQPRMNDPAAWHELGQPRLCFLVSAGAMDSMVNHYTAAKKPRRNDAYSPGGQAGHRPDRALIQYVNMLRSQFKGIPIIIGGIEASLRRLSHYDYWSDTVKRSVLLDSKADLLVYGMGESQVIEIVSRLAAAGPGAGLAGIRGTVRILGKKPKNEDLEKCILVPSHSEQVQSKQVFAKAWAIQAAHTDPIQGRILVQSDLADGSGRWLWQEPPALPLEQSAFDAIYALPYTRTWHPMYDEQGGIPALEEVQFSLVSSRGCFGSCAFCAITFHQGRIVQGRSAPSLVQEAQTLSRMPGFKGYIHDVGGPTANFHGPACARQKKHGACPDRQCLSPSPCPSLQVDHRAYLAILRQIRKIPGIKKVFIRSGIRYDYLLLDPEPSFLNELCEFHISGRLKVAPEHVSDRVLAVMGKPPHAVYTAFLERFAQIEATLAKSRESGPQQIIPYFISSHPGSTLDDAIELALYLKRTRFVPDSVQDFYPTPGTRASTMFYTGLDPDTLTPVYVAKGEKEKALQRALLQYNRPENATLVREALVQAGRTDLIGRGPTCLIR